MTNDLRLRLGQLLLFSANEPRAFGTATATDVRTLWS